MNKTDLINHVQQEAGINGVQATKAVNAVFDTIAAALVRGESLKVPRFGTFAAVEAQAREGRNPQTGEVIVIPERRRVTFTASDVLRTAVREGQS